MPQALSPDEIPLMRSACQLAAKVLLFIEEHIQPGQTTAKLDQLCHDFILSHGAAPAPLGYNGFPKSICSSVNSCICHGVPDNKALQEGDIVNIDVTCIKHGFHGDTSKTFFVGEVSETAKNLTDCALQAMHKGIKAVRPNGRTGDIGFAIEKYANKRGFFPVREIGGHGIGRKFHDDPFVPSFGKKGRGDLLTPWTCLTVEPMLNESSPHIKEFDIPGSSVKYYHTIDGSLSAQFEHTILIKAEDSSEPYEILTQPEELSK